MFHSRLWQLRECCNDRVGDGAALVPLRPRQLPALRASWCFFMGSLSCSSSFPSCWQLLQGRYCLSLLSPGRGRVACANSVLFMRVWAGVVCTLSSVRLAGRLSTCSGLTHCTFVPPAGLSLTRGALVRTSNTLAAGPHGCVPPAACYLCSPPAAFCTQLTRYAGGGDKSAGCSWQCLLRCGHQYLVQGAGERSAIPLFASRRSIHSLRCAGASLALLTCRWCTRVGSALAELQSRAVT